MKGFLWELMTIYFSPGAGAVFFVVGIWDWLGNSAAFAAIGLALMIVGSLHVHMSAHTDLLNAINRLRDQLINILETIERGRVNPDYYPWDGKRS
jgi:hypothetical protein